jgi:hypothetical protein
MGAFASCLPVIRLKNAQKALVSNRESMAEIDALLDGISAELAKLEMDIKTATQNADAAVKVAAMATEDNMVIVNSSGQAGRILNKHIAEKDRLTEQFALLTAKHDELSELDQVYMKHLLDLQQAQRLHRSGKHLPISVIDKNVDQVDDALSNAKDTKDAVHQNDTPEEEVKAKTTASSKRALEASRLMAQFRSSTVAGPDTVSMDEDSDYSIREMPSVPRRPLARNTPNTKPVKHLHKNAHNAAAAVVANH